MIEAFSPSEIADWLYHWQTIIAGVFAVAVGFFTIAMVRVQIKQQDRLHEANQQARFRVARAKTPLAAVQLAKHASECAKGIRGLVPLVESRSHDPFFCCPGISK